MTTGPELRRTLGPFALWGLGVGYVISGMYFGWNLGLPKGGPFGLLAATLLVTVLYVAFVLGYAELACAIPRAGGAFVYAERAFGPTLGFVAGAAQSVEFVFAPPAIAAAIGAHVHLLFPWVPALGTAFAAYVLFTGLNAYGVRQSAAFELAVTLVAVAGLLVFAAAAGPRFSWAAFSRDGLRSGWWGIWPAIPYAIWFYLAIEGIANVAEEARDPQRDLARGFGSAMATLVALTLLTFFCAVGVAGWPAVVYEEGSRLPSDSPLPLALGQIVRPQHPLYRLVVAVGVCGLLASFHGILLVAGRAIFELGRMGYAPRFLGEVHPRRLTPVSALLVSMAAGLLALLTGRTAQLITISAFGALTLYTVSMAALFALRRHEPELARPFRAPLYPWVPATALALSLLCLVAMAYHDASVGLVYLAILGVGYGWFHWGVRPSLRAADARP